MVDWEITENRKNTQLIGYILSWSYEQIDVRERNVT
jgi:hypothetical protein